MESWPPRPDMEPVTPALEGDVLTAEPPGKSLLVCFILTTFL